MKFKHELAISMVSSVSLYAMASLALADVSVNLEYRRENIGVFEGRLTASGLLPNHKYVLTLNGWSNHPSNKLLPNSCQIWEQTKEKYCDIDKVSTDDKGNMDVKFKEKLPKGIYKIKFLIKDTNDWIVVWSDDLVKFEVR